MPLVLSRPSPSNWVPQCERDVAPSNCRNTPTPNPRCLSVHLQLRSIHYLVSNNDAGDMIPNSKSCLYFQFHPIWECLCQTGDAYTPAVFMYKTLGFWPRVVVEDPAWQKTCHLKPETSLRNTRATSVSLYPILPFQLSLEEPSSHEAQREFHLLLIGCLFPVLNCLRHVWTLYSTSPVHSALICLEIPPTNLIGGAAPRKSKPWTLHVAVAFLQCSSPSFLHSTPLSSGGD